MRSTVVSGSASSWCERALCSPKRACVQIVKLISDAIHIAEGNQLVQQEIESRRQRLALRARELHCYSSLSVVGRSLFARRRRDNNILSNTVQRERVQFHYKI